ncbi:hypothetical protein ON010_g18368 [Phytophthora cinnamomi]|nr:hypothetical protein ON010_g18368 [Phytophthora cinnamomi]
MGYANVGSVSAKSAPFSSAEWGRGVPRSTIAPPAANRTRLVPQVGKWNEEPKPRYGRDFQSRKAGASKAAGKCKRQSQSDEEEDSQETAAHSSSNIDRDVGSDEGSGSE